MSSPFSSKTGHERKVASPASELATPIPLIVSPLLSLRTLNAPRLLVAVGLEELGIASFRLASVPAVNVLFVTLPGRQIRNYAFRRELVLQPQQ